MQPIQINVSVSLGLSRESFALLSALVRGGQPRARRTPAPAAEEPERPAAPAAEPKPAPTETHETLEPSGDMPEEVFYPSEEDVRAAMDKTRQRIEGEDYKNNTTSEAYVRYHKRLTTVFKSIAAQLGSEKPSTLPQEKRGAFIDTCALLNRAADGEITIPNVQ